MHICNLASKTSCAWNGQAVQDVQAKPTVFETADEMSDVASVMSSTDERSNSNMEISMWMLLHRELLSGVTSVLRDVIKEPNQLKRFNRLPRNHESDWSKDNRVIYEQKGRQWDESVDSLRESKKTGRGTWT